MGANTHRAYDRLLVQQTSALADAVDRSFADSFRRLADREHGISARFGNVEVAATGLSIPFFNPIFVLQPLETDDDLAHAVAAVRQGALPFVVHVREDLGDGSRAAEALQLRQTGRVPGMALSLPISLQPPMADLDLRRVVDETGYADFIRVGGQGFELPIELLEELLPAALFNDPAIRAYVAYVDQEAVATSVGIQLEGVLGIFNVATHPTGRRAGYGTAITWHAIANADPGTEAAVLQSSEMGLGVYERMGFRTVVEYLEFEPSVEES